jgi:hypothetical protein
MSKLFLDDIRPAPDSSWAVVRSYETFCDYIRENGVPDFISFDHDLADEHYPWNDPGFAEGKLDYANYREKTGYDCVKWLLDNGYKLKEWRVHSMNAVGATNIRNLILGSK